jgi:hypothetical protein
VTLVHAASGEVCRPRGELPIENELPGDQPKTAIVEIARCRALPPVAPGSAEVEIADQSLDSTFLTCRSEGYAPILLSAAGCPHPTSPKQVASPRVEIVIAHTESKTS